MLQWFFRFSEFTEFTKVLFLLRKMQNNKWEIEHWSFKLIKAHSHNATMSFFSLVQIMGFSLNKFHWICWIQWIITKSKKWYGYHWHCHCHDTVTFLVIVTENTFSLKPLCRYLSPRTKLNIYKSRGSNRNPIFATLSENVINTSRGVFLATIHFWTLLRFIEFSESRLGKTGMASRATNEFVHTGRGKFI